MNAALSGLRAADTLQAVAASNVANVSTDGYRARRAELAEQGPGRGVAVTGVRRPDAVTGPTPEGFSGVDIGGELVGSTIASATYSANLTMLRAQDETTGALISLFA